VISPSIDADALAARLDRLPACLRDALARELDRLARNRRFSVSIATTADAVTATIRTAGVPPALAPTPTLPRKRGREARAARGWGLRLRSGLPSALAGMTPEIRAGLESAARQAFAE
jgi:hypothetical protein